MEQEKTAEKEKVREEGEKLMKIAIKEFMDVGINAEFMTWTNK